MNYEIYLNGVKVTRYVALPIKTAMLLDERLDEGKISLRGYPERVIPPLTEVRLVADKEYLFVVSGDSADELPIGSGQYDHELSIVEQTKLLEGYVLDTLTFTNALAPSYPQTFATVTNNPIEAKFIPPPLVETPQREQLAVPAVNELFQFDNTEVWRGSYFNPSYISVTVTTNGDEVYSATNLQNNLAGSGFVLDNLVSGLYLVEYTMSGMYGILESISFSLAFYVAVVPNLSDMPDWTIATVCDRLFALAVPSLKGDAPRFVLSPSIRAKLDEIPSPEFAFTGCTLKDALDQIGGYIHGIPRLKADGVSFDFLGGTEYSTIKNKPYVLQNLSQTIEQFCSKIDSTAENLLNTSGDNVLVEPQAYRYKTVRAESAYIRIDDGNMRIETQYPIYEVLSLEFGDTSSGVIEPIELAPYVFEKADYDRLSKTSGAYPLGAGFAIYYTQGEKHIQGLNFKYPNAWSSVFEEYSIVNIIRQAKGDTKWDYPSTDYPLMMFRIVYRPVFEGRITQTKEAGLPHRALVYNQSSNFVESKSYGEHMKGVIKRLGNVEKAYTFIGQDFTEIPLAGQRFDKDYYIAGVSTEYMPHDHMITLALSKDFNRLSAYIGINSQKRFYEVSEKAVSQRTMNYCDYIVVGFEELEADESLAFSMLALGQVLSGTASYSPINFATLQGEDSDGNLLKKIDLPVVKTRMGNSAVFIVGYVDNYGAGEQAEFQQSVSDAVTGYYQRTVPYGDYFGRIEYLHIQFNAGKTREPSVSEGRESALAYPESDESASIPLAYTPVNRPLVVKKDGRERLSLTYQIEAVSGKGANVIFFKGFVDNLPQLGGVKHPNTEAKIVLSESELNNFGVDTEYSGTEYPLVISGDESALKISDIVATVSAKSWCVMLDGEPLFGKNIEISAGDTVSMPYLTRKHNI